MFTFIPSEPFKKEPKHLKRLMSFPQMGEI